MLHVSAFDFNLVSIGKVFYGATFIPASVAKSKFLKRVFPCQMSSVVLGCGENIVGSV